MTLAPDHIAILGYGHICPNRQAQLLTDDNGGPAYLSVDLSRIESLIDPDLAPRLTRAQQIAMIAASRAIARYGHELDGDRTGVFVGTGLGNLTDTLVFLKRAVGPHSRLASPLAFVHSVHNAIASQIAITFGLAGCNHTCTHGRHSFAQAMACAAVALFARHIDRAVVIAVDAIDEDYLRIPCRDCVRMPGEGGAAFVVARGDDEPRTNEHWRMNPMPVADPLAIAAGPLIDQACLLMRHDADDSQSCRLPAGSRVGEFGKSCGEFCTVDAVAVAMGLAAAAGLLEPDAIGIRRSASDVRHVLVYRDAVHPTSSVWWLQR